MPQVLHSAAELLATPLTFCTTTNTVVMYSDSTTSSLKMRSANPRTIKLPCVFRSIPCTEPLTLFSSVTLSLSSSSREEIRSEMPSDRSRRGVFIWNLASSHSHCLVVYETTGTATQREKKQRAVLNNYKM